MTAADPAHEHRFFGPRHDDADIDGVGMVPADDPRLPAVIRAMAATWPGTLFGVACTHEADEFCGLARVALYAADDATN